MPIMGEIHRAGGYDYFEIPDPPPGGMVSARLQILPDIWRMIIWAPAHIIGTGGAGRVYFKDKAVGIPISTANLPTTGASGTLTDTETGTTIKVTRTE